MSISLSPFLNFFCQVPVVVFESMGLLMSSLVETVKQLPIQGPHGTSGHAVEVPTNDWGPMGVTIGAHFAVPFEFKFDLFYITFLFNK